MGYLRSYAVRQYVSISAAMVLALTASRNVELLNPVWTVLSALMVCQTTRGTPIRQGLMMATMILLILSFSIAAAMLSSSADVAFVVGLVLFILINYTFCIQSWISRRYNMMMLSAMIIMIALSPNMLVIPIEQKLLGAAAGGAIGMFSAWLIFPVRPYHEFRQGLAPLLRVLEKYVEAASRVLTRHGAISMLAEQHQAIETALTAQKSLYPGWVYELGFNPGLRSGFRFYLIHIERLIEIMTSLNVWLTASMTGGVTENISTAMSRSLQKNAELINLIKTYFRHDKLQDIESNFTDDITELEKVFHTIVPDNLELLDISPDYIKLTAMVRDIKDMRAQLLQLIMALPQTK